MKLFTRVKAWILSLFTRTHFKRIIFVGRMSDIPEVVDDRTAYIVEKMGRQVWLVFNCPCSNPHRLTVNLSKERTPFWQVTFHDNKISVYPSVWLGDGCGNHFWIRNNNISKASEFQ